MKQAQRSIVLSLLALALGAQQPTPSSVPPPPKIDRTPVPGVGELLVGPQRVILEGAARTADLTLVNTGPRTASYRIYFTQMEMLEDGRVLEAKEKPAGGKFAEAIVRYSPRQVTLEPGIAQAVRISLRKPENLAPGEYRSHLVFRYMPEPDAAPETNPTDPADNTFSVKLTALPGIAIPVVVRHGTTSCQVAWESARVVPGNPPTLEASLARTGNQTAYGDVKAIFTPNGSSQQYIVQHMGWVGVYDPMPRRTFSLPLTLPEGQTKGTLLLQFTAPESPKVLAETRLEIK